MLNVQGYIMIFVLINADNWFRELSILDEAYATTFPTSGGDGIGMTVAILDTDVNARHEKVQKLHIPSQIVPPRDA
jgi:hypothetical protein